jgi:hypothetical protein
LTLGTFPERTVATVKVIDLDDHRDSNAPVLSGRPRGKAVRESTRLDGIDDQEDNIVIREALRRESPLSAA